MQELSPISHWGRGARPSRPIPGPHRRRHRTREHPRRRLSQRPPPSLPRLLSATGAYRSAAQEPMIAIRRLQGRFGSSEPFRSPSFVENSSARSIGSVSGGSTRGRVLSDWIRGRVSSQGLYRSSCETLRLSQPPDRGTGVHARPARIGAPCGLKTHFEADRKVSPALDLNWAVAKDWSEESRYDVAISVTRARDLYNACTARVVGVLPWVRRQW